MEISVNLAICDPLDVQVFIAPPAFEEIDSAAPPAIGTRSTQGAGQSRGFARPMTTVVRQAGGAPSPSAYVAPVEEPEKDSSSKTVLITVGAGVAVLFVGVTCYIVWNYRDEEPSDPKNFDATENDADGAQGKQAIRQSIAGRREPAPLPPLPKDAAGFNPANYFGGTPQAQLGFPTISAAPTQQQQSVQQPMHPQMQQSLQQQPQMLQPNQQPQMLQPNQQQPNQQQPNQQQPNQQQPNQQQLPQMQPGSVTTPPQPIQPSQQTPQQPGLVPIAQVQPPPAAQQGPAQLPQLAPTASGANAAPVVVPASGAPVVSEPIGQPAPMLAQSVLAPQGILKTPVVNDDSASSSFSQ